MKYRIIPVTAYQQNCCLIICSKTRQAAIVDPGGDIELLLTAIKQEAIDLVAILVTHGHLDHVGAIAELAKRLHIPIYGPHLDDDFWIANLAEQVKVFGFPPSASFTPNRWLVDGDQIQIGELDLEVIHCPGHTPGHVVFFNRAAKLAWVGDVLFKGSIGRTDFPKGNHQTLINSITHKLWPLGADVAFIPGHGPMSTFGAEMLTNPYVGKGQP